MVTKNPETALVQGASQPPPSAEADMCNYKISASRHLPDGHLPDGHLPDGHLPDGHQNVPF